MFTTHTIKKMLENDKFKMDKNLLRDYVMRRKHSGHRLHFIARVGLEL
jgi:hypothetical protein